MAPKLITPSRPSFPTYQSFRPVISGNNIPHALEFTGPKNMLIDDLRISIMWEHMRMTTWGTMHVRTRCRSSHPQLVFIPLEPLSSNWPHNMFGNWCYVGGFFGLLCMSCVRPAVEQRPSCIGGPDHGRRQIGIFGFTTPGSEAACSQDCS